MLDDNEQRMKSFRDYLKNETRFSNPDEFLAFCKDHFCYYPPDFGYWIQTVVTNDQEFIDFIQRVSIDNWFDGSGGLMWFVNQAEDNPYVDLDSVDDEDDESVNPDILTEPVESYRIDYNEFYEQPFAVIKDKPENYKRLVKRECIRVRPEIQQKMPFIARFVSHDTFDRMGSIKGNDLDIIPLSELKPGQIMFR